MEDHRDESLLDKIKNVFGMGDDERSPDVVRDDAYTPPVGTDAGPDAGYSEPFTEDPGGPVNRPTGPDYGASDLAEDDFAAGLDRDTIEGTRSTDTGPVIGDDEPYDTVSGPGPMGGGATIGTGSGLGAGQTVDETEWTRGGAASGEGPFDTDRDVVDEERRETGI